MQIQANVNYHVKKTTPQAFLFDVDGVIGNLVSPELVPTEVNVSDLRGSDRQPDFQHDGIAFVHQPSEVKNFERGTDWTGRYNQELIDLLKAQIGATEVIVFDHTVRIDDPEAPRRPARNVHNDYNQVGAEKRLVDLVGESRAESFHSAGYGFVNVWRPIETVITTSPLGFIRPSSIRADDWMDIALVYPERIGQILASPQIATTNGFFNLRWSPMTL